MSDKTTTAPVVGAQGIWYAYLSEQEVPGDGTDRPVTLSGQDAYGNTTLFSGVNEQAVALTTQSLVWIEIWFRQASEILADREVAIQVAGSYGSQVKGRAKIVGNYGQARYAGLGHTGETFSPVVNATSDVVKIAEGYISVIASPI